MENYIANPNLPEGSVSLGLVDIRADNEIVRSLKEAGVEVIKCGRCPELYDAVSCHPDMLMHHLGGNNIVIAPNAPEETVSELARFGFNIIKGEKRVSGKYPGDVAYNVARIGDYAICNVKTTDTVLLDCLTSMGVRILNIKQGYAKCSICIVDRHAIITSDEGIYKFLSKYDFDILKISPGHIALAGLDYGFIGGASGLIGKGLLSFAGRIDGHPDYDRIQRFLWEHSVGIKSLSCGVLADIGSFIPLKEYHVLKNRSAQSGEILGMKKCRR